MCTPKYRLFKNERSFLMAKYSFEFKLKVVQDYLDGIGGYPFLAHKYHMKGHQLIENWVHAYQAHGIQGLERKRKNTSYSTQFKLNAVNLYLTSKKSYQTLSNELRLNNPALLARWVLDYRQQGNFAFGQKPRGRPRKEPTLQDNKKTKLPKIEINKTEQELARLQNENLNLRMENEYLKGLRRLRMERQAKGNPDLFKTSTDN